VQLLSHSALAVRASSGVVAMCNCLITGDSCRPAIRFIERKQVCIGYNA